MLQLKRVHKKAGRGTAVSSPPQRYFRSSLILLVLSLIILLPSLAYAASVTKSDGTDGVADGGTMTRTVEFTTSDFSAGASISSVTTTIQFAKIDAPNASDCFAGGHQGGSPYNREVYMYLTSPTGTKVGLVEDAANSGGSGTVLPYYTYTSNDVYGGTATVVFDDGAATQVGGPAPASGTFRPEQPLSAFMGEDPLGTWTLLVGDSVSSAPTCVFDFSLTVNAEQAPVVNNQTFSVAEDSANTTVVDTIVATDADTGDKLTYTVTGGTGAAVFDVGLLTGEITVADDTQLTDPGGTTPSSFTLNVTVTDSSALSDTAVITITVDNVNDAPVITDEPDPFSVTMSEDGNPTPFSLTLNATDQDGDDLTWSIQTDGIHGTASIGGTNPTTSMGIDYTPNANYNGSDSFVVQVSDGNGGTDTITVNVTITAQNDAPVITESSPISVTMDEDGSLIAFLLTLHATDVDSTTLTWSISSPASRGTASASGTGDSQMIGYAPNPNYNGNDSFVVQVSDGDGEVDTITVNVTINPVNDAPIANDDSDVTWATNEDTVLSIAATGVLANDTDQENDSLTVSTADTTSAKGAAVLVATDGSFSYDPRLANTIQALDAGDSDTDTFTYTASDGNGGTDTATVTIALTGVNDAPVATANSYNATEDTNLVVDAATGVLANDTDVDADDANTLTAVLNTTTSNGTLNLSADGSFTYMPNAEYSGSDSFTYHANDGTVDSNTVTVTINVAAVNDPPVANDDSVLDWATDEDTTLNVTVESVLDNDTDQENDSLTVSVADTTSAKGAAVLVATDGTFSYDPRLANTIQALDAGDLDTDTFTYTASDGNGGTDTATVTIALTGVNDAPVATANSYNATEDTNLVVDAATGVLANDTDVDADDANTLTAVLNTTTSNGTLNLSADGSFTYMPNAEYSGSDSFTYHANDGTVDSNIVTVTINVVAYNDLPTITQGTSTSVTMSEDGSPTPFSLSLNATDPDGNTLTWSIQSQAISGTASASGTGSPKVINYTPTANYNGSDSFVVRVSDGNGGTDTITVNVTINPVNDAPVAVDDSTSTPPETAVVINVLDNDTDVENDTLTVTAVTQGSKGSVTHNGTTVTYTPNANETGNDTFTYTISDGNGGSDTATVTIQLGLYEVFVPLVLNNFVSAPDLVVTQINASSDLIEVVIKNQGTQATTNGFWVDFYINPNPVPTHENQLWNDLSTEGLVWGVNVAIAAGDSLTLRYSTAANAPNLYYSAINSSYSGNLPVGTPVYAQVDSAHLNTVYGGVLETHEILGTAYNNVSAQYTAGNTTSPAAELSTSQAVADPVDLPLR